MLLITPNNTNMLFGLIVAFSSEHKDSKTSINMCLQANKAMLIGYANRGLLELSVI